MVADSLWGSTPMTTLAMLASPSCRHCVDAGRALLLRAGQTPLQPRTGTVPDENANRYGATPITLVGSRTERFPPNTWTESGRTPVLPTIVK